jgi:two-component system response regulator RegX3
MELNLNSIHPWETESFRGTQVQAQVLIIEDEIELAELIQMYLNKEGIDTEIAASAEEGIDKLAENRFDLIVLDINLPGIDGFEFLQEYRKTSDIPVIIVSAREADEDIVMGLGIGADEFVTKPFSPKVLSARIRAILRRARTGGPERQTVSFQDYEMDIEGYVLQKNNGRISLSSKEFEVLRCLVLNRGKTLTPHEIYEEVWQNNYGDITAIGVYIRRLRKKLGDDTQFPQLIQTIHGRGYRINPAVFKGEQG